MSEYEIENAAYKKGYSDAITSERARILRIVEEELMSDYGNVPWNIRMFHDIKKRVEI